MQMLMHVTITAYLACKPAITKQDTENRARSVAPEYREAEDHLL
jgi:hypothetical protein